MNLIALISPYTIAIIIAWSGAHAIKYIIGLIKKEKLSLRTNLFRSGGMPSAHSATIMSIVTVIGLKDGFDSGLFGLSVMVAMIVMYDAMKVRRSSGEQGVAIAALIKEQNSKVKIPYVAKGHLLEEVIVGAIFGVAIGIVVFLATK